ncbi:efflux RND transporter periplasmic adaptor subunit [Magnetovirga frankeli]|uniref:efflux RND transporter periplasmic adaptor subunit n=1 Tax=Magnetovirga frankeli TaxID=947516 RepID=UPI0012935DA2|nr:efflux RND transporter periplasmic adaptor subunit [gamma proteobacterium SS-5]
MTLRTLASLLLVALVFGGYYGWKTLQAEQLQQAMAQRPAPVQTVSTAKVTHLSWRQQINATGNLLARRSVELDAQEGGIITDIYFQSGQEVKAGDALVKIDDTPEQAQLKGARAALDLAQANLKRKQELQQRSMVAPSDIDQANEQVEAAQAEVDRIQDLIRHKLLKAPFDGVLGLKKLETGAFVSMGAPIVELSDKRKMLLYFFVPERYLSLVQVGKTVEFTLDAFPGERFTARISAKSNRLTKNNRALEVEALADNPDGKLLPGMFCSIQIPVSKPESVLVVPKLAILYSLYGDSVFVVTDQGGKTQVSQHQVKLGMVRDGQVQVLQGLNAGDDVVIAGQGKLKDGMRVQVDNSVMPQINNNGKGL